MSVAEVVIVVILSLTAWFLAGTALALVLGPALKLAGESYPAPPEGGQEL